MVENAVSALGAANTRQVVEFIKSYYPKDDVNKSTISAYMIACSVNHSSAHHYPNPHHFLFYLGGGQYRLATDEEVEDCVITQPITNSRISSRGSHSSTLLKMDNRVDGLCSGFSDYIAVFDKAHLFSGPSWYFHLRTMEHLRDTSLSSVLSNDSDPFFELLYATLTSWGMHRMGPRGAKLVEFEDFRYSIVEHRDAILSLEEISLLYLSETEIEETTKSLADIMDKLRISATRAKLVANSKTLHHLLPHLMPPIDREYTLQFMYGNKMYSNDRLKFLEIYPRFYYIGQRCKSQIIEVINRTPFHSSPSKVIDNAIVGYVLKEIKGK